MNHLSQFYLVWYYVVSKDTIQELFKEASFFLDAYVVDCNGILSSRKRVNIVRLFVKFVK